MKKEIYQGKEIEHFTLTNANDTRVTILSLGGIIQEYSIMHHGQRENMIVNFDSAQQYAENPYQICKQIGRIAGRIKDARFELDGKEVQVPANENHNCLHGGDHGVSSQVFDGYQVSSNEVTLTLNLNPTVDGFPGDLTLMINYILRDNNRLDITYDITAQTATVYDPTIHIYWALTQGLKNVDVRINGTQRQETDAEKIPTGKLLDNVGTAFDFSKPRDLAKAIEALRKEEKQKGFDNGYAVEPSMTEPVVEINEKDQKVKIKVFSDRNGLVIFTADPQNGENDSQGIFDSLATEVQTLPDALHHNEFGNVRLAAGEHKQIKIAYQVEGY